MFFLLPHLSHSCFELSNKVQSPPVKDSLHVPPLRLLFLSKNQRGRSESEQILNRWGSTTKIMEYHLGHLSGPGSPPSILQEVLPTPFLKLESFSRNQIVQLKRGDLENLHLGEMLQKVPQAKHRVPDRTSWALLELEF